MVLATWSLFSDNSGMGALSDLLFFEVSHPQVEIKEN